MVPACPLYGDSTVHCNVSTLHPQVTVYRMWTHSYVAVYIYTGGFVEGGGWRV